MFNLGNTPILASIEEVMLTLQAELRINGSPLLREVRPLAQGSRNLVFTCPYHKFGQERKPSAGIAVVPIVKGEKTIQAGTFSCFTCKKHGNISELISHCLGVDDGGATGTKWIYDHFNSFEVEERDNSIFKVPKRDKPEKSVKAVNEDLAKYRYYHPYQKTRYLSDRIVDLFDVGYDSEFRLSPELNPIECITFPIRDAAGKLQFIARRSINSKLFHYPHNVDKGLCFQYEVNKLFPKAKEVWICESLLNSLVLIQMGIPSICLLGTGTSTQYKALSSSAYRKFVLCLDNDVAGTKGTIKLISALQDSKLLEVFRLNEVGKDINDYGYLKNKDELYKQGKFYKIHDFLLTFCT